jgi:3-hydroxy-3-methylglutaryl CoA synthase
MIGISGYAAYLPRYRLNRALVGGAWGRRARGGTKAVANYDEDPLTMAAEAALDVVGDGADIDRLYFASTSAPYREKQVASLIATACDLPRAVGVSDFTGSVRASTGALRAALEAVASGGATEVVVAAADMRLAAPESDLEPLLGDGAAALRVGRENVLAEFVGAASVAEEFTHLWRTEEQRFVQAFEGRFSNTYGYTRAMSDALTAVLQRAEVRPERVSALALFAPDVQVAAAVAKSIGCGPSVIDHTIVERVGVTGTPDPFLGMVLAFGRTAPGDFVLVGSYGEGADALLFRATEGLRAYRPAHAIAQQLDRAVDLSSYERYLKYRRVVPTDPPGEPVTNVLEFQELRQDVRLYGSRCLACGLVQYPMARVCLQCEARDKLADHKLAHRGRVFTFTVDHLSVNIEHPLPMAVVDLDGGGRLYLQVTDANPEDVRVGAAVELCFRRLHEGGGNYNYFWKAKPADASGWAGT